MARYLRKYCKISEKGAQKEKNAGKQPDEKLRACKMNNTTTNKEKRPWKTSQPTATTEKRQQKGKEGRRRERERERCNREGAAGK